ncbi:response regulator transcription factor [Paenibacillus septentrionalis]|uniref:Response regulator transcription factor n=1 Tax=Paenibacillus septentrionalis TaxID=429342 RepID=A0ABW1V1P1_9BACL
MNIQQEQHHILVIEDDEHINKIISDVLRRENYICTSAFSGSEAKLLVSQYNYQLIILDLMLPGLSGEAFMHYVREELKSHIPVIVLSAKDELDHKLQLFDLGAVDYVTKPFEVRELLARINVHIGKNGLVESTHQYKHKKLILDCNARSVTVNKHLLNLTRQEYRILELLLKSPTRVFTKRDLYELAWDDVYLGEDKTITVHISNIRNKIKQYDDQAYIDTVWGIGFRISP